MAKAFHDVAVQQRDEAWREIERLRAEGFRCPQCDTLAVEDREDGYCEHCR
jgi:hypothetical protein